jgi:hypothetical protein
MHKAPHVQVLHVVTVAGAPTAATAAVAAAECSNCVNANRVHEVPAHYLKMCNMHAVIHFMCEQSEHKHTCSQSLISLCFSVSTNFSAVLLLCYNLIDCVLLIPLRSHCDITAISIQSRTS